MLISLPKGGFFIALLILCLVLSSFGMLLNAAPRIEFSLLWQDDYYLYLTWFSFYQALLSTLLSLVFAFPVAIALYYRRFWGRAGLLKLFSMTLVLPVLVAIFGLVALYGNQGILAQWTQALGGSWSHSIYGLSGILLAHVFFNLPYASRLLLQSLESIPLQQHRLALHLGLNRWQSFRRLLLPSLLQPLPHIAGLVFMLCFTSFTTVMALGGGPKATTIELAIYHAMKFDYDLATGALLALWQIVLCASLSVIVHSLSRPAPVAQGASSEQYCFIDSRFSRIWDWVWISLSVVLVVPPLIMVILDGLNAHWWQLVTQTQFWQAIATSLQIALLASLAAVVMGVSLLNTSRYWRLRQQAAYANGLELIGTLILVMPSLVLSTGLFLLLRYLNVTHFTSMAFWLVVLVNSLMALPYTLKQLSQPMWQVLGQYHLLMTNLGLRGWARWRWVEWQLLKRPLAQALALSFLLSLGDLSAIALFGHQDFITLPWYLYQLLASYQMQAAGAVALVLLGFSLLIFFCIERLLKVPSCSK